MPGPHPLTALIDDDAILGAENWNKRHVLLKQAVPVSAFLNENDVHRIVAMPLLRRPYFSVLKEGVWANPDRVTRAVEHHGISVDGLVNPAGVREALKQGATLKLNQLEDWHEPTRTLVREVEARVPAELKAYVFYTPQDNTGMRPHRDGSHVLAVQLAGHKEWRLYADPGQVDARPDLVDVDPQDSSHEFVMEPGDVLYLPHGYPHAATARGAASLHLTLTITEPGPVDLIEALLTTFMADHPNLMREHAGLRVEEKVAAVADALLQQLEGVSADRLLETALDQMRRRVL